MVFDLSGFDVPTYWDKNADWLKTWAASVTGLAASQQWALCSIAVLIGVSKVVFDIAHYGFKENPQ
jgi:hypothetical protein